MNIKQLHKQTRRFALAVAVALGMPMAHAQSVKADTTTVYTVTADSVKIETVVTTTTVHRSSTSMARPDKPFEPAKGVQIPAAPAAKEHLQTAIDIVVDSITSQPLEVAETPEMAEVTEIPMFSREIENVSFVPKGQWITGVSVSYSQSTQNNYQFLILQGVKGDTYTFKVSPMLMYAFADNLAAGGRFAYSRSRNRLDNASIVLDSETSYDVDHLYTISHNYAGTMVFRNYLSLGSQTRFGLFNEVQIEVGGGQSKVESGQGIDYTGIYSRNFNLGVGLAPGLVMFLNNYSAIEVNVGVLGFDYKHMHSVTDQIYVSDVKTKSANFRINLFSIMFGCTFYI